VPSAGHGQSAHAALAARTRSRGMSCNSVCDRLAHRHVQAPRRGFLKTGSEIVKRETPLGLYKGLGAVLTGIIPKMAIRFTSYEWYKQLLADGQGNVTGQSTFLGMPLLEKKIASHR